MNIDKEFLSDLEGASKLKHATYNYLYRVFAGVPEEDFLGVTKPFTMLIDELAQFLESENLKKAVATFTEYEKLETAATDKEKFLENLNVEYTGLFLLGGTSTPTSASVYLSPERLIKREPWERMVEIYRRREFKMPENFKEPEDHIAMQLLYLQKLNEVIITVINEEKYEYIEDILKEQQEFVNKELLSWVPQFAKAITSRASEKDSLYYASAITLEEFLKYDSEMIAEFL